MQLNCTGHVFICTKNFIKLINSDLHKKILFFNFVSNKNIKQWIK